MQFIIEFLVEINKHKQSNMLMNQGKGRGDWDGEIPKLYLIMHMASLFAIDLDYPALDREKYRLSKLEPVSTIHDFWFRHGMHIVLNPQPSRL